MASSPMPRIFLAGNPAGDDLRSLLEHAGYPTTVSGLSGIDPAEVGRSHLVILDVTLASVNSAQALCRRWRIELGEQYVPMIWLCFEQVPALFAGGLDSGADVCLARPVSPEHLLSQVRALLRVQHLNARLLGRAAEASRINQQLQQAYQQIECDLELTRRIHRSFLPRSVPEVLRARFAVSYRPRSRMGGDFYDLLRLDEENVALYVADAMGRGLPASSLLSIYIKRTLIAKEITGNTYRLIPPGEVLSRLNRELANLGLQEPPFVTMLYMQLNCQSGMVTFARAGHPNPLHLPAEGEPEYWHALGTMLGVVDAEFMDQSRPLQPGDRLLLYSDGAGAPDAARSFGQPEPLLEIARTHRHLPLDAFLDRVTRDVLDLSRQNDDFTMLVVEYR